VTPKVSVVVPVLNEAAQLGVILESLRFLQAQGHELILVDGGSSDDTPTIAAEFADRLLTSEPGRARQMNAGARVATGDILWFLHADTLIPSTAVEEIIRVQGQDRLWGRFDVRLSGTHPMFRLIEGMMNLRCR
jgi:glycosyltransferase involved in cell wall biosynthesis